MQHNATPSAKPQTAPTWKDVVQSSPARKWVMSAIPTNQGMHKPSTRGVMPGAAQGEERGMHAVGERHRSHDAALPHAPQTRVNALGGHSTPTSPGRAAKS